MGLPQAEVVALVQTEEVVHNPDKRNKSQNERICLEEVLHTPIALYAAY